MHPGMQMRCLPLCLSGTFLSGSSRELISHLWSSDSSLGRLEVGVLYLSLLPAALSNLKVFVSLPLSSALLRSPHLLLLIFLLLETLLPITIWGPESDFSASYLFIHAFISLHLWLYVESELLHRPSEMRLLFSEDLSFFRFLY